MDQSKSGSHSIDTCDFSLHFEDPKPAFDSGMKKLARVDFKGATAAKEKMAWLITFF